MKKKIIMALLVITFVMSGVFCAELCESSDVAYRFGCFLEEWEGENTEPTLGIVVVYHLAEEDEWFRKLLEFVSITDEYYPSDMCHWYCMDKNVFEELERRVKGIRSF